MFYCVFVTEMILKVVALGFKGYFADNFNKFDLLIIIISTIDITLSKALSGSR